ncbi:CAP-associated domain-containing protein [Wukongibacter baidiensis]|uniref:stalk domain-containing protein n=1 Tax=Wukongibacter baidiensis TaxID=1723361 RepID=UPI003D7FDBEC
MKKIIGKTFFILLIFSLLTSISINRTSLAEERIAYGRTSASKDVRVKFEGHFLNFDVDPMIINGRTLVPFRVILEALGAEVGWDGDSRTVSAIKDNLNIKLKIDSTEAFVNSKKTDLDVPAMIIDGRTLIPVRFISEELGCTVDWDGDMRIVTISTSNTSDNKDIEKEFTFQGIAIGDSEKKVINVLGQPTRKDLSKYGFRWYIYNGDYSKYIQVGVNNNKVVGIYTNASNWVSKKGIETTTSKEKVQNTYGKPLTGITKGNTIYKLDSLESDTYLIEDYYTTIFYDLHKEKTLTAILLIDKEVEESLKGYFGEASDELKKSYERQVFDLANAIRARFNKNYFKWDDKISNVARNHSEDMAKHSYFSHVNLEGKSPFERMKKNNVQYIKAAENIAGGQPSAIFAHEGWMNSAGHRKNILGDCERLGVGVYLGGDYNIYYTQNFYTPMK